MKATIGRVNKRAPRAMKPLGGGDRTVKNRKGPLKKPTEPLEENNGGRVPPNVETTGQGEPALALGPGTRCRAAGVGSGRGRSGVGG